MNTAAIRNFIIIDDNPLDQFVYEKTLLKTGIAQTVTCFGWADEALDFLKTQADALHPTIILVDLQMPAMNGFEFVESFCRLPEAIKEKVQIFMLSSTIDINDMQAAKKHPAIVDILHKPLDVDHLKTLLN